MSKNRLVITAVVVEGRSVSEVAATYGVARSWVYTLLARYRTEGDAAFEARSRRPINSPKATPTATVDLIIGLRRQLSADGLDAGPETIAWHLERHHGLTVSAATIGRYLTRAGLVTPEPKKRPRSSFVRFAAELPNQRWQSDFFHWQLTDGTPVEIVSWIDDHSRYALNITACPVTTGEVTAATFTAAVDRYGIPASTVADNGLVYTSRFAGGHGGRNRLEKTLQHLQVQQTNGRPNHPQTQGKVERFQQTLEKWLTAHPAATITELQAHLDRFRVLYNTLRPHRGINRATPATAYTARPKTTPANLDDPHYRVRTDTIDTNGTVTLRHAGRLHHIGVGRAHAGVPVTLLVIDLDIRIVATDTGEILRHLTLDPTRSYQPTRRPPRPTPRTHAQHPEP